MSILDFFRGREPTNVKKTKPSEYNALQMVTAYGESFYSWNGKLYESDIVRACLRPKVKAIGKLKGKHSKPGQDQRTGDKITVINEEPRIRFLLEEPNPHMSGQMLQEKMAWQLTLNGNAFALIVRDRNGYPESIYPIPCTCVEAIYDEQSNLYLKFTYQNGKQGQFAYEDIIHIREDYNDNDIFGSNPMNALSQLMECVGVADQGFVKAIKNSNIIRWLLKFNSSMRPEDISQQTKDFVNNYLTYATETFGVASVDQKVDAQRIDAKDFVPNASVTDRITDRIYSFFNTNKKIVQSDYDEDTWNAYYESEIEPLAIQLSEVYTNRLFSRRERVFGNKITFESASLIYASVSTKLRLTELIDRGVINVNEFRTVLSLPTIPGGDVFVRRLDTAPVQTTEENTEKVTEGGAEDAENRHKRIADPE